MRWLLVVALVASCKGGKQSPTGAGSAETPKSPVNLPTVSGAQPLADTFTGPMLVATPTAILVEGKAIVPLANGAVDAAEKEGGANGVKIPRLSNYLGALRHADETGLHYLHVAMDRELPYKLLLEILFSAKQKEAGWNKFAVIAQTGTTQVAIPIVLPEMTAASAVDYVRPTGDLGAQLDAVREGGTRVQVGGPRPSRGVASNRVAIADKRALDDSSLTTDIVLAKIQSAYMAGVMRCYKELLAKDPAARGKITLELTVAQIGRTSKSASRGFDASLDACIGKLMESWRFPVPKDDKGEPTEASFQITLELVPDDAPPASSAPPTGMAAVMQQPPPEDVPLGVAVTVTAKEIVLWSISGLEGTLQNPRVRIARTEPHALADLGRALDDIVARRWAGKSRAPETQRIILMAEGNTTIQTIAEVFAAVRTTPDGKTPRFPDIMLASGFE